MLHSVQIDTWPFSYAYMFSLCNRHILIRDSSAPLHFAQNDTTGIVCFIHALSLRGTKQSISRHLLTYL